MKLNKKYVPLTFDEVLQDPSLSRFHELINYLEKTPNKEILPKKYEMSIQDLTTRKVQSLFDENPHMPLKNVLALVMDYLPDDLSAKLLLKMTQLAIKKWEKLSEVAYAETSVSQPA